MWIKLTPGKIVIFPGVDIALLRWKGSLASCLWITKGKKSLRYSTVWGGYVEKAMFKQ